MRSNFAKHLKWLLNAITLCRGILALTAFIVVLSNKWATGLWLLLAALSTDFLDGLAAKKLNAVSKFGEEFDSLTDSLVVVLGMLSLSITDHLSWWITALVLTIGVAVGSDRILDQPRWKWRAIVAVVCLFIAWVGIVWFYAYLAFGWLWWYVPITLAILGVCGLLKRHRIRTWLAT